MDSTHAVTGQLAEFIVASTGCEDRDAFAFD